MSKAIAAVLFVRAGVLLGGSFAATPAKFPAMNLPMTQALGVDRWTFHMRFFAGGQLASTGSLHDT